MVSFFIIEIPPCLIPSEYKKVYMELIRKLFTGVKYLLSTSLDETILQMDTLQTISLSFGHNE